MHVPVYRLLCLRNFDKARVNGYYVRVRHLYPSKQYIQNILNIYTVILNSLVREDLYLVSVFFNLTQIYL